MPLMLINYIRKEDQTIKITPNHPSDINQLFQFIDSTNKITMSTTRKVEIGTVKKRIPVKLTVSVTETSADFENCALNVRGKVVNEVENVKIGSFHNFTIGLNDSFVIHVENGLQRSTQELLKKLDVFLLIVFRGGKFEVAAIDEYGLRNKGAFKLKEFKKFMTEFCSEEPQPKQSQFPLKSTYKVEYIVSNHQITNSIKTKIPVHNFNFQKEHEKLNLSQIFETILEKSKSSSIPFMKDLILANNFLLLYEKADDKIALGMADVEDAQSNYAIEVLFVTNKLYCAFDIELREKVREMVKDLKRTKKVVVLSDSHKCGQKLNEIGGIGAILTYNFRFDS